MALDPRKLLKQAIGLPRALKVIAAIALVDAIILLFAALTLEDQVDGRVEKVGELRGQLADLQKKIDLTHKQIDRLPELQRLYDAAFSDGVLADQDRLKLINRAQELGTEHRLTDLHYKLAAEETAPMAGSKFLLVTTAVNLTDGAMIDGDILAFWDEILGKLQAHYKINKAVLERSPADLQTTLAQIRSGSPAAAALVRSELDFRWISLRKPVPMAAQAGAAKPPATTASAGATPASPTSPAPASPAAQVKP